MLYHTLHLKRIKLSESFSQVKNLVWLLQLVFLLSIFSTICNSSSKTSVCSSVHLQLQQSVFLQGQEQDIDWSFIAHTTDSHLCL